MRHLWKLQRKASGPTHGTLIAISRIHTLWLHPISGNKLTRVNLLEWYREFRKPWCSSVSGPSRDIFSHDWSLACRLAIPRLKIPVKVTHLFVLFDLLRSVFLLKDVVDFDPGGLDFGSPSLTSMSIDWLLRFSLKCA